MTEEWSISHRTTLIAACCLEIVVAIIIAIGIGGGWTEWNGKDTVASDTGGANFGPCIAPSCGGKSGSIPKREPPALLEAIFGLPLLLAPAALGAAPTIVRSFSARFGLARSIAFSALSAALSSLLYFVIAALLFIGILRYVLDPSLFPEIILFPLALLPIPWSVDQLTRIILKGTAPE